MMSLSDIKQPDIIEAFKTTSIYLDDILNINNIYFDNIVEKYTLQSLNLIKIIPQILKPRFGLAFVHFISNDIVSTNEACIGVLGI